MHHLIHQNAPSNTKMHHLNHQNAPSNSGQQWSTMVDHKVKTIVPRQRQGLISDYHVYHLNDIICINRREGRKVNLK